MIFKNLFFQKCNLGIKKAEFDDDLESVEKVENNSIQKIY
jgi:hypothetical protein